jgi:hypothetical protein
VLAWTLSVFCLLVAPVWAQNQAIPIKLLVVIYDPIIRDRAEAQGFTRSWAGTIPTRSPISSLRTSPPSAMGS